MIQPIGSWDLVIRYLLNIHYINYIQKFLSKIDNDDDDTDTLAKKLIDDTKSIGVRLPENFKPSHIKPVFLSKIQKLFYF